MSNHDTEKFETPPPPPPPTEPPPPPVAEEQPRKTWRDRRVGLVALAASIVAALFIGGTLGAVSGAAVGYGVGHHDHPDRPALVREGQPLGGMPGQQQFMPPNGALPPGTTQEQDESQS